MSSKLSSTKQNPKHSYQKSTYKTDWIPCHWHDLTVFNYLVFLVGRYSVDI